MANTSRCRQWLVILAVKLYRGRGPAMYPAGVLSSWNIACPMLLRELYTEQHFDSMQRGLPDYQQEAELREKCVKRNQTSRGIRFKPCLVRDPLGLESVRQKQSHTYRESAFQQE